MYSNIGCTRTPFSVSAWQLLLKRGAAHTVCNRNGRTPLHIACCCDGQTGNVPVTIEVLMDACTDLMTLTLLPPANALDATGATPLELALTQGTMVRYIIL